MRVELADGHADLETLTVHRPGGVTRLTMREGELLAYLAARPLAVVSRQELLTEVWRANPRVVTRAVDNSVQRLREKIEVDPQEPRVVVTVFGEGYRFVPRLADDGVVGRAEEVGAVEAALAATRVVTLLGPGGIGKSTLARRVARGRRTLWISLGVGLPARAILEDALGLQTVADPQLPRLVAQRADLLVIDGAEEELEGTRSLVGLVTSPVLVTSRVALGIAGEQVVPVPPLPEEDAVRLIRRRSPVPIDDEVGLGLARGLAGWPLAIELCMARVAMFGPSGLLAQIQAGPALLGGGDGTIGEAVGWALDRLTDAERSDVRRLSVWPGELSVEDAAALLDGDVARAADRVARLVEASLLRRIDGDPPRFGFLDPVRGHLAAARTLAETTAAEAGLLRRAVTLAAALTPAATGLDAPAALVALRARHALLLAAWAIARDADALGTLVLALDPRFVGGNVGAWIRRLDTAIAAGAPVHLARGEAKMIAGDLAGARADFEASGSPEARAWIGRLLGQRGEHATAEATLLAAIAELDGRWRGIAESFLGGVLARAGRPEEALEAFRRATALLRRTSPRNLAIVISNVGILHMEAGRFADAAQCHEEALAVHRAFGDRRNEAIVGVNLGGMHVEQGDMDAAEAALRPALAAARDVGDPRLEGGILTNLGLAAIERGRLDEADRLLGRALEELALAKDPRVEALAAGYRGVARLFAGRPVEANRDLDQAVDAARRARDPDIEGRFSAWRTRSAGGVAALPEGSGGFDRRLFARSS